MDIKVKSKETNYFYFKVFGDSKNPQNCILYLNCTMMKVQDLVRPNPEIC